MKSRLGLKKTINFNIIFFFILFNTNKLFSIESAALNMGLAECLGVYKELEVKNLLDREIKNALNILELKVGEKIDSKQLKEYENIGRNKIKSTNLKDIQKINDILLGCKNLKNHLR